MANQYSAGFIFIQLSLDRVQVHVEKICDLSGVAFIPRKNKDQYALTAIGAKKRF